MIIGNAFDGDIFEDVKHCQHDLYGQVLERIYRSAVTRYKQAERILQQDTELGCGHPMSSFDHRTLQELHDRIAAFFSYSFGERLHPELPGLNQYKSREERITRLWLDFFDGELSRLFDNYPDIVRLVLIATAYANPDRRGSEAEETLYRFVLEAYSQLRE
ncbi:hypothetical protein [Spiribacter roseus]|uniref:hypothetical protein n=1 Tax=Spiribacter roseus TaxID=1855875 RepID=UPI0013307036|nr:hypothetical protein [Spiribacter roseus]KAF0282826.1 hypothetical protein BA898_06000 [Spiribacter roseus]